MPSGGSSAQATLELGEASALPCPLERARNPRALSHECTQLAARVAWRRCTGKCWGSETTPEAPGAPSTTGSACPGPATFLFTWAPSAGPWLRTPELAGRSPLTMAWLLRRQHRLQNRGPSRRRAVPSSWLPGMSIQDCPERRDPNQSG